jgi:hypothetical protein
MLFMREQSGACIDFLQMPFTNSSSPTVTTQTRARVCVLCCVAAGAGAALVGYPHQPGCAVVGRAEAAGTTRLLTTPAAARAAAGARMMPAARLAEKMPAAEVSAAVSNCARTPSTANAASYKAQRGADPTNHTVGEAAEVMPAPASSAPTSKPLKYSFRSVGVPCANRSFVRTMKHKCIKSACDAQRAKPQPVPCMLRQHA